MASKKDNKKILTEDVFNANGDTKVTVNDEKLIVEPEIVETKVEPVVEIVKPIEIKTEKPVKVSTKKAIVYGFNDENLYM